MTVHFEGFAAPFNVSNDYDETFDPHVFDEFIKELEDKTIPFGFMHEGPIGECTKLWTEKDGLWVHGIVTSPFAARELKDNDFLTELSVSFQNKDGRFSRKRVNSFRKQGYRRLPPAERVDPVELVKRATLSEISVVTQGAFPGTHVNFFEA